MLLFMHLTPILIWHIVGILYVAIGIFFAGMLYEDEWRGKSFSWRIPMSLALVIVFAVALIVIDATWSLIKTASAWIDSKFALSFLWRYHFTQFYENKMIKEKDWLQKINDKITEESSSLEKKIVTMLNKKFGFIGNALLKKTAK